MPVIRKPDMTKKMSTPMKPPGEQFGNGVKVHHQHHGGRAQAVDIRPVSIWERRQHRPVRQQHSRHNVRICPMSGARACSRIIPDTFSMPNKSKPGRCRDRLEGTKSAGRRHLRTAAESAFRWLEEG